MSSESIFEQLEQIGTGNNEAATDLIAEYGLEIRRFIRFRMRDSVLRRLHDSVDVEQSVFRRFFQRASAGNLNLRSEDELRAYLFALAKNRVSELKRGYATQKRKASYVDEDSNFQLGQLAGNNRGPHDDVAEMELMMEVRSLVGTDDWEAVGRRLEGHTWKEVAEDRGTLPDTIRKRLQTALKQLLSRTTPIK